MSFHGKGSNICSAQQRVIFLLFPEGPPDRGVRFLRTVTLPRLTSLSFSSVSRRGDMCKCLCGFLAETCEARCCLRLGERRLRQAEVCKQDQLSSLKRTALRILTEAPWSMTSTHGLEEIELSAASSGHANLAQLETARVSRQTSNTEEWCQFESLPFAILLLIDETSYQE